METIRYFIFNTHALAQWVPPLVLAVLLRVITMRWKHQLVFPICTSKLTDLNICLFTSCSNVSDFMIIPIVFYVVVAAAQLDLGVLRRDGWLFDMAEGTGGREDKWYGYHSYLGENVSLVKRLIPY
jgi:SulP family sulfate permease